MLQFGVTSQREDDNIAVLSAGLEASPMSTRPKTQPVLVKRYARSRLYDTTNQWVKS